MRHRGNVVLLGGLLALGLITGAAIFFQRYAIVKSDSGSGFQLVVRNHIQSTFKEGFLVPQGRESIATVSLGNHDYFKFHLYEGTSPKSGFFEIWSEADQSGLVSRAASGKIIGKKIRLELQSKKIGALMGDVWFIRPSSGS